MTSGVARPTGKLKTKLIRSRPRLLTRILRRLRNANAALHGAGVIEAMLSARHYIAAEDRWVDKGVICRKLVTDAYVELLVDELQASVANHSDFKFHGSGTGTTAPVVGDTTLETEVETRDSGTQAEAAAAIYQSVATHTYAGAFAITEHGLLNISTAGTLMDRSTFAAINVVSSDKIEFTYELTVSSGG